MEAKIKGWTESVAILSGVTQKLPQSAYAGLQKSLQQEWAFMQRVTPGVSNSFGPVEKAMKETIVPSELEVLQKGVMEQGVTRLPSNRRDWPFLTLPRRPLRTGWRPVLSQDT